MLNLDDYSTIALAASCTPHINIIPVNARVLARRYHPIQDCAGLPASQALCTDLHNQGEVALAAADFF